MNSIRNNILSLAIMMIVALAGAETVKVQENDSAATAAKSDSAKAVQQPAAGTGAVDTSNSVRDTVRIVTPTIQLKVQKDTVLLITDKEEIAKIVSTISGKVRKSRIQGYGGAGGFGPRIGALNMDPIVDILHNNEGITFPTLKGGYTALAMNGGLGYGGLGNGIRIGGGGWGGSRRYTSNPFKRVSGAAPDSVAEVTADFSYGGFLIEKAFVRNNWNIIAGGMIGGGGFSANIVLKPAKGASAFSSISQNIGKPNMIAALGTLELHGGTTYTAAPWLHIGGDASMLFYNSFNGFESPAGGSFWGVMPSIGFRIIFGNIG